MKGEGGQAGTSAEFVFPFLLFSILSFIILWLSPFPDPGALLLDDVSDNDKVFISSIQNP